MTELVGQARAVALANGSGEVMLPAVALDLLAEIVPIVHARGDDHYVEALAVAMDALTWFPLRLAPRDGQKVTLAVQPAVAFNSPGYICIGRWVEPDPALLAQMGKLRRQRYEAAGGWWSAAKSGRPFDRPVLAWRPVPYFDFADAGFSINGGQDA